jgi:hypothetical protein
MRYSWTCGADSAIKPVRNNMKICYTHTQNQRQQGSINRNSMYYVTYENSIANRLAACFIHILFTYIEFQGFSSVIAQDSMLLGFGYNAAT